MYYRACMHDPEVYDNPHEFRPERFIKDGQPDAGARDPYEYVFGFGRRICPGRHYAEAVVFINLAFILHVFDVSAPRASNNQPIVHEMRASDGYLLCVPFSAQFSSFVEHLLTCHRNA